MTGILPLDKPAGISSAQAVNIIKRLLPRGTKIGHAGTLDPFATGALIVLIGKATKLCERLMDAPKQYIARAKLGASTATDDLESQEIPCQVTSIPSLGQVKLALAQLTGTIEQKPPQFSALKFSGRPAYDILRKGGTVDPQPRSVQVYSIEHVDYAWPYLSFDVECGRGTYIRSMARDVGAALSVGGYLIGLRRSRVGNFGSSYPLRSLEHLVRYGVDQNALLPLVSAD